MPPTQRAEGARPRNALDIEEPETYNDDRILNGILPKDEKLAVTSSLHPFWHTKRGGVVIGLVILVVIGAIVGGAVGGKKAGLDSDRESISSTLSASTTSQASNDNTASVTSIAFSATAGPSDIVRTTANISSTILPVSRTTSLSAVTTQNPITSQHQPAAPRSISPK